MYGVLAAVLFAQNFKKMDSQPCAINEMKRPRWHHFKMYQNATENCNLNV
jgi:hypothetical protein